VSSGFSEGDHSYVRDSSREMSSPDSSYHSTPPYSLGGDHPAQYYQQQQQQQQPMTDFLQSDDSLRKARKSKSVDEKVEKKLKASLPPKPRSYRDHTEIILR